MKQEIQPAKGRLGILLVGLGGAVSSTCSCRYLGSSQRTCKTYRIYHSTCNHPFGQKEWKSFSKIKDVVPLADLNDLVFGGWDIFEDDVCSCSACWGFGAKDLDGVKEELQAIKPMKAAFDQNWVKRLHGTHVKQAATAGKWLNRSVRTYATLKLLTIVTV